MGFRHIWACRCGANTPCTYAQVCVGATFRCPECGHTFGAPGGSKLKGRAITGAKAYKWVEMKVIPEDFDPGDGWRLVTHPDGCQQVSKWDVTWPHTVFIERVVSATSKRKRWCVVDRKPPDKWAKKLYAPKLAGPFPDLDAAKAAYLMIMAA